MLYLIYLQTFNIHDNIINTSYLELQSFPCVTLIPMWLFIVYSSDVTVNNKTNVIYHLSGLLALFPLANCILIESANSRISEWDYVRWHRGTEFDYQDGDCIRITCFSIHGMRWRHYVYHGCYIAMLWGKALLFRKVLLPHEAVMPARYLGIVTKNILPVVKTTVQCIHHSVEPQPSVCHASDQ